MQKYIYILILILFSVSLQAQTVTVSGYIRDTNMNGIENANVVITPGFYQVYSTTNGFFAISRIPQNNTYNMLVRANGYIDQQQVLEVDVLDITDVEIQLIQYSYDLCTVSIFGDVSPMVGIPTHYMVEVGNVGSQIVGFDEYRIFINLLDPTQGHYLMHFVDILGNFQLEPGTWFTYTIMVVFETPGQMYLDAEIYCDLDENPDNNRVDNLMVNVQPAPKPLSLSADVDYYNVTLTWDMNCPDEVLNFIWYNIYRDAVLLSDYTNDFTYTDINVPPGTYTYSVSVSYVFTGEESEPVEITGVIVYNLLPPTDAIAITTESMAVSLSWTAPDVEGIIGYKVYRKESTESVYTQVYQTESNITLSYNDTDISSDGFSYTYYITAVYPTGESVPSNIVSASILPPPINLTVTEIIPITLSWVAPDTDRISHYIIYRKDSTESVYSPIHQTEDNTILSYSDSEVLSNGTIYQYYVTAIYPSGESDPSNIVSTSILPPPINLTVNVSLYNVALAWESGVPDGVARALLCYKVYRENSFLAESNTTSYSDTSVPPGTYTYQVTAIYTGGESSPTQISNVIVYNLLPPVSLQSTNTDSTPITLSWTAPEVTGITRYKVYRKESTASVYIQIYQTENSTTLSYGDSDVESDGSIYQYYVSAVYPTGESGQSNVVTSSVLPRPINLTANVALYSVRLAWESGIRGEPTRALLGYKVYRDNTFLSEINTATYTDTAVSPGNYTYKVTAIYTGGESNPVQIADVIVYEVIPPASLSASIATNNSLSLNWTNATTDGVLYYNVYRFTGSAENITHIYQTEDSTTLTYTDTNVVLWTEYSYFITSVFTTGESEQSNIASATPIITTFPWNEAFDSGALPEQWTENGGWAFSDGFANTTSEDMLFTPPLGLLDPAMVLTFTMRGSDDTNTSFTVFTSTDGINTQTLYTGVTIGSTHQSYQVSLASLSEQMIYIAFAKTGNAGSLYLDEVRVGLPILLSPINLQSMITGPQTISLNWEFAAPEQVLRYNIYRSVPGVENFTLLSQTSNGSVLTYNDTPVAFSTTYYYYVTAVYPAGESAHSNITSATTLSEDDMLATMPVTSLSSNYPNPFNPITTVVFDMAREGYVYIEVYNSKGQRVRVLVDGVHGVGRHSVVWDGHDDLGRVVSSGVYFYRMVSGEYTATRKMLLMK